MALSDAAIRKAKAGAKPTKLSDGGGLFLLLNPNGSRLWRLKYRFAGKEKLLAFSAYPQVSLKDAREWFGLTKEKWESEYADLVLHQLERDMFPWPGSRPIAEIAPLELLTVMRRIEQRGVIDLTHRALQKCGQIFRYAIVTG